MSKIHLRKATILAVSALVGAGAAVAGQSASVAAKGSPGSTTGPSSSESPYLVRAVPGVTTTSLLTVGDSPTASPGYRMVGIPDGLGAFDNGDGTLTVVMNHELRPEQGVVRDHRARGAFVSKWIIDKDTLEVVSGDDLIKQVFTWNGSAHVLSTAPVTFNRLCSADLADPSAFYDPTSGLGYQSGRLFANGEEAGTEGRGFIHVASGPDAGKSYELPAVGNMSFENVVSRPVANRKTVTAVTDDSTPGQVYMHVGEKKSTGSPAERAGLTGGNLFGIKVNDLPLKLTVGKQAEDASKPLDGKSYSFTGVNLGDATSKTGEVLEAESTAAGVTQFARPEDGAWSADGKSFVFATTASFAGHSRIWQLSFTDPTKPAEGGTAKVLYEGPATGGDGPKMMDNLTVNSRNQVLAQEDPGNQAYLAGIFQYDPAVDAGRRVATFDPARFTPGGPGFLTVDEESSGIIPLDEILGRGHYLIDAQVHATNLGAELVEDGQLLVMHVPPGQKVAK